MSKTERPIKYGTILGAAAFWRNNQPNGVGVEMQFPDEDGDEFAASMDDLLALYDVEFEGKPSMTPEIATGLLRAIATSKTTLRQSAMDLAFSLVYWLSSRKHIGIDEFNGVVWHRRFQ